MARDPMRVVEALRNHEGWVDASYLADALGVSTRTVRTYVRKANEALGTTAIESSHKGYRLAGNHATELTRPNLRPQEERADAILRRLISCNEPLSIYDLASELYVSDSTIESDLRLVRDSIRLFDLTLARKRDTVQLEGSELSKRKLIGQLLSTEGSVGFTVFTGRGLIAEGYDGAAVTRMVSGCLENHGLRADDFGINNVVIHLVVMVDRMRHGMQMPDDGTFARTEGTAAHNAACDICRAIEREYDIDVPRSEEGYLALVIASNSRARDYSFARQNDLTGLVDARDIDITQRAVGALERAYYLEPFNSDFVTRMAVHVHSLLQRVEGNIGTHNPLMVKIKETYPLVYDMAVFFARSLAEFGSIDISEDEIAFLAFHIGAYLEANGSQSEPVTAAFLYMDYHEMYRLALDRIRAEFKSALSIVQICPVADYATCRVESDIVLSPVEVDHPATTELVVLSPIINDADIRAIRKVIDARSSHKRGAQALSLISRFLVPELFERNAYAEDATHMIRRLSATCLDKGYVNEGFCDEVLAREAMSPTSFANRIAIPHSMSASANRSFLAIVVNEQPMAWGPHQVNIIMLLGISASDRKVFRLLFDSLLEVLSEPANVSRLIKCDDYSEFITQLNDLITA